MGLQRGRKTASLGTGSRIWWNWQTRYFEVVVGQPVQVQVLLCAPIFSGGMTSQRRPAKSDCCRLIRSSQIAPTPENHTLLEDLAPGVCHKDPGPPVGTPSRLGRAPRRKGQV